MWGKQNGVSIPRSRTSEKVVQEVTTMNYRENTRAWINLRGAILIIPPGRQQKKERKINANIPQK